VEALELMSRRDVLKGLTGLALTSCRRGGARGSDARRGIQGTIVGGSHQRGHRLREGFRPRPDATEDVGVVIVGAGVAGLSAAWALERAGLRDYVVLELEDVPGGTARSGVNAVTPYPWGAHYVPVPSPRNRPLVALLGEVGAVAGRDAQGRPIYAESVLCREPEERVYFRGHWYEGLFPRAGASASDLAQFRAFEDEMKRWSRWRDARGRRGFVLPRASGSDADEIRALDRQSMAEYLAQHGWDSPRLRWFVEYGCRDDFGTSLVGTSAWAGIHYFAARLEDGAEEPAEFLTWPEGNGRLVTHLAGLAGRRLRTGALVTDLLPLRERVEVTYYDEATRRAVVLKAAHAVFALPRFLAGILIAPWRAERPPFLAETVYGSWMVANLTLRDRPSSHGFPIAWDNVIYDSPSLGYVVATHQSGSDHGPTVFTYYLPILDDDPRKGRDRLLATTWGQWVDAILADLGPAHPGLADLIDRIDVYLWGHAMVQPRPGFLWSDALAASSRPLGRVHFAHTDLSGMALFEEAQHWGIRAAEAILRERGVAFRSWLGA
jgi:glycine/D-amino acid oxidase-like deaminating enzyme